MRRYREQNSRWGPNNGLRSFGDFAPNEWPLRGRRSQESRKPEFGPRPQDVIRSDACLIR
jgi:hypothetical protein